MLSDISFGDPVAEHDVELRHYFVATRAFNEIIADKHDLVLGIKGSGKSAIHRILCDQEYDVPELGNTIILPAFNIDNVPVLQNIVLQLGTMQEGSLRIAWRAFTAALVGNHLVDEMLATPDLVGALKKSGLRVEKATAQDIWSSILSRVKGFFGSLSFDGELVLPIGVKAKIGLTSAESKARAADDSDNRLHEFETIVHSVLQCACDSLATIGYRVWVTFDRLDEIFADTREMERSAIRALLRTTIDLRQFGPTLRLKLFLRQDVFNRITRKQGFTNLTHLRAIHLTWSREAMADAIARRVWMSSMFRQFFQSVYPHPSLDLVPSSDILGVLLVDRMPIPNNGSLSSSFAFVTHATWDASQQINPRNVVTFMQTAQRLQIDVYDSGFSRGKAPQGHLISGSVLERSTTVVGKLRLEDTLFAEHQQIRETILRFRYGKKLYDRNSLARQTGIQGSALDDVVEELIDSGFLRQEGPDRFAVGDLYEGPLSINNLPRPRY